MSHLYLKQNTDTTHNAPQFHEAHTCIMKYRTNLMDIIFVLQMKQTKLAFTVIGKHWQNAILIGIKLWRK